MNCKQTIASILRMFSGQTNTLTVQVPYIKLVGSIEGAVLLSQMIYWSDRTTDPEGWFYKTYAEWFEEIYLTEYQVRKHSNTFKNMGFLETKVKKVAGNPTLHYRIDAEKLSDSFLKFFKEPTCENLTNLVPEKTKGTNLKKLEELSLYTETTYIDYTETTSKSDRAQSSEPESEPSDRNTPDEFLHPVNPNPVKPEQAADDKYSAAPKFAVEEKEWKIEVAPWRASAGAYKDEMLEAVYRSDRKYYGLEGGKRNDVHIKKYLIKLENSSRFMYSAGCAGQRMILLQHWADAIAICESMGQESLTDRVLRERNSIQVASPEESQRAVRGIIQAIRGGHDYAAS